MDRSIAFVLSFALLLSLFLSLLLGEAKSDEFKLIPSLGLSEQYNDNLLLTERNKKDDFITSISPGLELSDRTERLDLNLSGHVSGLVYARNEELNDIDYDGRGRLLYSINPNLKFSAGGGLWKISSPGEVLEPTGLVTRATQNYKYYFGSDLEYTITEKTKTSLSYSYERYDYEYGNVLDILDTTTEAHGASIGFIHDLSQYFSNTAGRMNLGYSYYQYRDRTVDYYYGTIGMSRALNEKWAILLDLGPSYTRSELKVEGLASIPGGIKETEKGTGLFGRATLTYRGEKTSGDLTFSHRLEPGSGTVGVTENTFLTLGVAHRFTYELSGRLSTGYYINKAERGEFSIVGIDEATFRISPAVRYEFTKDIALEASYNYTLVKDRLADTEAKRNLFMINFIIQCPLFE